MSIGRVSLGRSLVLVGAVCVAFGLAAHPTAAFAQTAQAQSTKRFDIPAQSLSTALLMFGDQCGLQMTLDSSLVTKKRSPELKGNYTPEEGLRSLLNGSGLMFRFTSANTVVIEKQLETDARMLGPVRVEGAQSSGGIAVNGSRDVTATEGTGSFTSPALTIGSKAPQSIKDTPQSVSVITAQRIQEQNITDFTQALAEAPGITLVQGDSSLQNTFYSRGFPITSIQIDGGAPLTTDFGRTRGSPGFFPLIDMAQYDHVEVLRGAAGLLNGYGDPSGTINLVRKKPLDHAAVKLEAQAGSWSTYRVVLDATSPLALAGKLRGRAVMSHQDNDYFYDIAKDEKTLLYGMLEYDLTTSTLLSAGISQTSQDSVPWRGGLPRYQNGEDLSLPRSTCLCFAWNRWDFETTEIFGGVEQKIGADWTAKLNLTRNSQESSQKIGFGSGAINPLTGAGSLLSGAFTDFSSEQNSAEMTIFGAFDLFGQRQEVTAGVNYAHADGGGQTGYSSLISGSAAAPYQPYPGGPLYFSGSANGAQPPINVFEFDPRDPLYTEPRDPLPSLRYRDYGQAQSGGYINLRLTAFDRAHLAVGFRYSKYEYTIAYDNFCTSIPASGQPGPDNCVGRQIGDAYRPIAQSFSDSSDLMWPPAVSLSYDVLDRLSAYVGYTSISMSQANYLDRDLNPIDPVTGSNIEAGLKWQTRDNRVNAALSAYRIEQKNYFGLDQSSISRGPDGSVATVDNAGNRHEGGTVAPGVYCCYFAGSDATLFSRGIDAELSGEVLPAWQVTAGYTYNENEARGSYLATLSLGTEGAALTTLQPEHLFKLWTSYRFADGGWTQGLTLSAGAYAQSKGFRSGTACAEFNPPNALGISSCAPGQNLPFAYTQQSYAVWSTRIEYGVTDTWSLAVNIDNLFDERYYKTPGTSAGGNWYGEPRNFMMTLRGTF